MNNLHWLSVCGDRTQFCHMQDDFNWEGFGGLGSLLGLQPGSLLEPSNCSHKKGTSPGAGATEHRQGKAVGRDLAASWCSRISLCGEQGHTESQQLDRVCQKGLLCQLWDLWLCTLLAPAGDDIGSLQNKQQFVRAWWQIHTLAVSAHARGRKSKFQLENLTGPCIGLSWQKLPYILSHRVVSLDPWCIHSVSR